MTFIGIEAAFYFSKKLDSKFILRQLPVLFAELKKEGIKIEPSLKIFSKIIQNNDVQLLQENSNLIFLKETKAAKQFGKEVIYCHLHILDFLPNTTCLHFTALIADFNDSFINEIYRMELKIARTMIRLFEPLLVQINGKKSDAEDTTTSYQKWDKEQELVMITPYLYFLADYGSVLLEKIQKNIQVTKLHHGVEVQLVNKLNDVEIFTDAAFALSNRLGTDLPVLLVGNNKTLRID